MSQLSAQSIRRLCIPNTVRPAMIEPFVPTKQVLNGKSYGLSAASYDLRIAEDVTLGPTPSHTLLAILERSLTAPIHALLEWAGYSQKAPPSFAIASTIETFAIPANVGARIADKSTYARMGLSCFNTFFDPGFRGVGTLELVNLSPNVIVIRKGDPICQIVFSWLDEATDAPYAGKYQDQPAGPQAAILEGQVLEEMRT